MAAYRNRKARKSFLLDDRLQAEMCVHEDDDIKNGETWSERFKDKEKQKDSATIELFWAEMKIRLIRRWGTISQAFREIDYSGDGQVNFLEFNGLLQLMHIPLEPRAARYVFTKASGGDKEIDLNELKTILMMDTFRKLKNMIRVYKKAADRTRKQVQNFLLALSCQNQQLRVQTMDRVQRSITVGFCRAVFEQLQNFKSINDQILTQPLQDVKVERADLLTLTRILSGPLLDPSGHRSPIQPYQIPWVAHIFERVGRYTGPSVLLIELLTTLILLSPDCDRRSKLQLLFECYDTDYDGVLSYSQVRNLFSWMCKTRDDFRSKILGHDAGPTFQTELSEDEGLRHYECARWRLQRQGHSEDTVSWTELWSAIFDQPDIVNSLTPGPPFIHWVMDPSPLENHRATHYKSMQPGNDSNSLSSSATGHTPIKRGGTPPTTGLQVSASDGNLYVKPTSSSSRHRGASQRGSVSASNLGRLSSKGVLSPKSSINASIAWAEALPHARSRQLESAQFSRDLTDGFKKQLRRLGNERLQELSAAPAYKASPMASTGDDFETSPGGSTFGGLSSSTPASMQWSLVYGHRRAPTGHSCSGESCSYCSIVSNSRASSANHSTHSVNATLNTSLNSTISSSGDMQLPSLPRLGSRGHSSQGNRGQAIVGLPRVHPMMSGSSLLDFDGSAASPGSALSASTIERMPLKDTLTEQTPLKWGVESLGRYRLLVDAHVTDKHRAHRALFPPTCLDTYGYRCTLCETDHALNPKEV